jgi:DHA3 family macrolide efflux protein-like MFS transporter
LGSALTVLAFSFRKSWFYVYQKMCLATLLMGCSLAALSFVTSGFSILLLLFGSGVGVAAVNAWALSLFQETVPYELKGRFFALLNTVCFAVMPLTFLVNGYLSEIWPLSTLILANGLGTVLLSVVIGLLPRLQNEIGVRSDGGIVDVV